MFTLRSVLSPALILLLSVSPRAAFAAAAPAATAPASCGNGHLDPGETCANCPADCVVHPCKPSGKTRAFDVHFDPPAEMRVSSITIALGYDSRRVSLPGSAGAESVGKRLTNKQAKAIVVTNDLDYALRAVFTRPGGIDAGRLFTVAVDACQGGPAPTVSDLGCMLEGCAAASGHVAGCACHVTAH